MELGGVVVGVADLEDEEGGFGGANRLCVAQFDIIREGDVFGEETSAGSVFGATEVVVAEGAAVDAADTKALAGVAARKGGRGGILGRGEQGRGEGGVEAQAADLVVAKGAVLGVFDAYVPIGRLVGWEACPSGGIRAVDLAVGLAAIGRDNQERDFDFLTEGILDGDHEAIIAVGWVDHELAFELASAGAFKDIGNDALSRALVDRAAETGAIFVGEDDAAAFDIRRSVDFCGMIAFVGPPDDQGLRGVCVSFSCDRGFQFGPDHPIDRVIDAADGLSSVGGVLPDGQREGHPAALFLAGD